ncbi:hypothetical protein [Sporolactobacillus sp. KGMB 08714]|uniref:hypothetical protein n=1 Tax=Sporolactobacillus sp. KGMB 08714 TaxID=3064704 RepID=UPI002FBEEEB4
MADHGNTLSMASLADRQKFYRDKALRLEQEIIFTREEALQLQQELKELKLKEKQSGSALQEAEGRLASLKNDYRDLLQKHQEAQKQHDESEKRIADLEKNQRSDSDMSIETYRYRVKGYEQLLSEVQEQLNDKEKRIALYERRLAILEKRLKSEREKPKEPEGQDVERAEGRFEHRATALLDYTWVLDERKSLVRGQVLIENTGTASLESPVLCFSFQPEDAADLKGRVYREEDPLTDDDAGGRIRWLIMDGDGTGGEEREGEIWIRPSDHLTIAPGETIAFNDFQIPFDYQYSETLHVDCFVFFSGGAYKIKSANQILINASFHHGLGG